MPEPTPPTDDKSQTPPDGQGKTPGDLKAGAGTDTAQPPADDKRYTDAEMKVEAAKLSDKSFAKRMRAELIKRGIDPDTDKPTATVEEYKSRAEAAEERARTFETRELVRDHLTDPKNRIGALSENMRAIEKLVMAEIEYEDGKPSNLPDAIKTVKSDAPGLFLQTGSANGGAGRQAPPQTGMDSIIRQNVGR